MTINEFLDQTLRLVAVVDADKAEPLDVMGVLRSIEKLRWSLDHLEWELESRLP